MLINTKYNLGQLLFVAKRLPYSKLCNECGGIGEITIIDGNMKKVSLTCGKCGGEKIVKSYALFPIETRLKKMSLSALYDKGHICYEGDVVPISCPIPFLALESIYYNREEYVSVDIEDAISYCDRQNGFNTLEAFGVEIRKQVDMEVAT